MDAKRIFIGKNKLSRNLVLNLEKGKGLEIECGWKREEGILKKKFEKNFSI